jgi:transcriptional regulator with XRE-family HTH domain
MPIACPVFSKVSVAADNLREIRRECGLTQEAVGKILGLQKEQISRIETGSRALSLAEKIVLEAALLGRPIGVVKK